MSKILMTEFPVTVVDRCDTLYLLEDGDSLQFEDGNHKFAPIEGQLLIGQSKLTNGKTLKISGKLIVTASGRSSVLVNRTSYVTETGPKEATPLHPIVTGKH